MRSVANVLGMVMYGRSLLAGLAILLAGTLSSDAAVIVKASNTNNLNLGSSWVGGIVPGSADTAQWNTIPGATNSTDLVVGLGNTNSVGRKSGTATIAFASNGAGTSDYGSTAVSSQIVNITGSVLANRQLAVDSVGSGAQAARVVKGTRFVTPMHTGSDAAIDSDDAATRVNTVAGGRTGNATQKLTVAYAGTPTSQFNGVDQSAAVGLTFAKPGRYQGSFNLAGAMLRDGEDPTVGATVQPALLNYNVNVVEPRRLLGVKSHLTFGNLLRGAAVAGEYAVTSVNGLADAEHTSMVNVAPGGYRLGSLTVGQTLVATGGRVNVPIAGTLDTYGNGVTCQWVPVGTAEAQDSTAYRSVKLSYSANVGLAHLGRVQTAFGSGETVLSAQVQAGSPLRALASKVSQANSLATNKTSASAVGDRLSLRGLYGAVGGEAEIVDSTALQSDATVTMQWRRRTPGEADRPGIADSTLPADARLVSDVVRIGGIADSVTYALQMSFDNRINLAIDGQINGTVAHEFAAGQLYLAEFDTMANRWLNAASLVTAGAEAEQGVFASLSDFIAGHEGVSLFDLQGSWGVDPATSDTGLGHAWVITAGNGIFAVDPSGALADGIIAGAGLAGAGLGSGSVESGGLAGGSVANVAVGGSSPTAVPEPGTLLLLAMAAALSVCTRGRGKRRQ